MAKMAAAVMVADDPLYRERFAKDRAAYSTYFKTLGRTQVMSPHHLITHPGSPNVCSPLTTHHSPLTTHHSSLTSSPLTAHRSPLTTHHSPLTNSPLVARHKGTYTYLHVPTRTYTYLHVPTYTYLHVPHSSPPVAGNVAL
eukprot:2455995-Prymnesium_polylepis.1